MKPPFRTPDAGLRRKLLQRMGALGVSGVSGFLGSAQAQAQNAATPATGNIGVADFVTGSVVLRRNGAASQVAQGAPLRAGDLIETATGAELHAQFDDGGYLAVRPGSSVRIDRYVAQGDSSDVAAFELLRGALRSVTGWIGKIGSTRQYQLRAGTATIGVRGTDHEVVYVPDSEATPDAPAGIHNRVNEGATVLSNERGQVQIAQGTAGFASRTGELPRLQQRMPGLFERLRTANDSRLLAHRQNLRPFMENKLRERGRLAPGQGFQEFLSRHPRIASAQGQGAPAAGGRQAQRQAEREARLQARRTPGAQAETPKTAASQNREELQEARRKQRQQERQDRLEQREQRTRHRT
jgi:FecR protein